jgi:hypothetical protein
MSQRLFSGLIGLGIFISLIGLLFLPAALNSKAGTSDNLMPGGLAIFSLGALMVSTGMYAKARALRAAIDADPNLQSLLNGAKRKGNCDSCHSAASVVQCTMHKVNLCTTCMNQHYEPRGCVYIPSNRRTVHRTARAAAGRR